MESWQRSATDTRGPFEARLVTSIDDSFSTNQRRSLACGPCRTQANIVTNTVIVSVILLFLVSLFGWQRIEPYIKHASQSGSASQQSLSSQALSSQALSSQSQSLSSQSSPSQSLDPSVSSPMVKVVATERTNYRAEYRRDYRPDNSARSVRHVNR